MGKRGKLNADHTNHAMPVDAPLYKNPPFQYRDVQSVAIHYETDEDALLALLPDVLELPDGPVATLMFLKYPTSDLGAYEETILGINALYDGQARFYVAHIVLNGDAPLAAGREIYGYPKKLAEIDFLQTADGVEGRMARPKGNLICSAGMHPESGVELPEELRGTAIDTYTMALRVIPSPAQGARPSICELVETKSQITLKEMWSGTGWAEFHAKSEEDPWHKLPVKNITSSTYQIYDMVLGFGRSVQDY